MLKYKDIMLDETLSNPTQTESQKADTILQEILSEEKRVAEDLKSVMEEVGLDE